MSDIEIMNAYLEREQKYMNKLQLRAMALDTNTLIARVARGTGKSEGIFAPRMIRVADSMPGELSFLIHKTYVALLTNIVPNIRAIFSQQTQSGRPLLEEGKDYVVGTSKLPSHFRKPRYPISYPKHSLVMRTGHNFQLVASDMPESVAGRSAVHAFIEEMKHQSGQKLKSRIFPALRGGYGAPRDSPYFQGITGVTDAARLDLGEDNWYDEFEKNVNEELLEDIVTTALHVDSARQELININRSLRQERNPLIIDALHEKKARLTHRLQLWQPILNEMRSNATSFLTASTFVNKNILGTKFFKNQYESLSSDEFLSSICNIVVSKVVNAFFANFKKGLHCYGDSYKYDSIMKFGLNDNFKLTAHYLRYFQPRKSLILGYDPGNFSSLSVAQEFLEDNTLRVIKSFTVFSPATQATLASDFNEFFKDAYDKSMPVFLYYDRAGNKKKSERDQITTDARVLQKELESYGYRVRLMNEGQRTIFYYEHYHLLLMLFGEEFNFLPRIRIDENECSDLVCSILLSPLTKCDNKIELDKTSERKVPLHLQARLTTQLSSSLMYLLFGKYGDKLPSQYKSGTRLVDFQ